MKKSERLSVLAKIEKAKEREEARKYNEFQKIMKGNRKKLSDLENYMGEYREKYSQITRNGAEAARIKSCYAFMSQLSIAISQQKQLIQDAESIEEQHRRNWLHARQRMEILEKTLTKFRDEELMYERRREQALADEVSRYKQRDH